MCLIFIHNKIVYFGFSFSGSAQVKTTIATILFSILFLLFSHSRSFALKRGHLFCLFWFFLPVSLSFSSWPMGWICHCPAKEINKVKAEGRRTTWSRGSDERSRQNAGNTTAMLSEKRPVRKKTLCYRLKTNWKKAGPDTPRTRTIASEEQKK